MYRRCVNEYLTRVLSSRYVSLSLFHNDYLQLKIVKVNNLHCAIRQESGFRSFGFSRSHFVETRRQSGFLDKNEKRGEPSP